MKRLSLLTIVAAVLTSAPAAADMCDVVLISKAFNISDRKTIEDFKRAALYELCKSEWSSEGDFETRAQNFNSGASYMDIFKGHGDAGNSSTTNTTTAHFNSLCRKHDSNVTARFFSSIHVQNTDRAVDAWKGCKKGVGLWSALVTQPNSSRFSIEVEFHGATPDEKLLITGYDSNQGFECKYNNDEIVQYSPRDHGGSDNFALSCIKTNQKTYWSI